MIGRLRPGFFRDPTPSPMKLKSPSFQAPVHYRSCFLQLHIQSALLPMISQGTRTQLAKRLLIRFGTLAKSITLADRTPSHKSGGIGFRRDKRSNPAGTAPVHTSGCKVLNYLTRQGSCDVCYGCWFHRVFNPNGSVAYLESRSLGWGLSLWLWLLPAMRFSQFR